MNFYDSLGQYAVSRTENEAADGKSEVDERLHKDKLALFDFTIS